MNQIDSIDRDKPLDWEITKLLMGRKVNDSTFEYTRLNF